VYSCVGQKIGPSPFSTRHIRYFTEHCEHWGLGGFFIINHLYSSILMMRILTFIASEYIKLIEKES
jgi:hypothetical protein